MVGLYEYDTATKEDCFDDLNEIIAYLLDFDVEGDGYKVLEKKGLRIQYIAQRLQELGE